MLFFFSRYTFSNAETNCNVNGNCKQYYDPPDGKPWVGIFHIQESNNRSYKCAYFCRLYSKYVLTRNNYNEKYFKSK